MISFYPGPSRVHNKIPRYVRDAYKEGVLSINHRSDVFTDICKKTVTLLKNRLRIPKNYTVFFTSSATECWEIIAQSVIVDKSYHCYNGAFGQKWFEYTKRLKPGAEGIPFSLNDEIQTGMIGSVVPGVICVTQNETSNGTQISQRTLRMLRKNNPSSIIAIDATSSMAGIRLDIKAADIWFASVQKCFGLPAGLGIMICSPAVISHTDTIAEKKHYNSLVFMTEMMRKWQTPYTPNVLGIYLLMRVLESSPSIDTTHKKLVERYKRWTSFLSERKSITNLVHNTVVRSYTVIPVAATPEVVEKIKAKAKKQGLLLGEGYGEWKAGTFRIANFPALRKKEIELLMRFLKPF